MSCVLDIVCAGVLSALSQPLLGLGEEGVEPAVIVPESFGLRWGEREEGGRLRGPDQSSDCRTIWRRGQRFQSGWN